METIPHTTFKTPAGEEMVVIPRAAFDEIQDALDAAHAARIMAEVAAGQQELLTADEVKAALDAPTLLAFWRHKRGLTQAELAVRAGISQSYVAALESGDREGSPALFLSIARALSVRMEDLVSNES